MVEKLNSIAETSSNMAFEGYCEDCGCKVFSGHCTNCHEETYIAQQYRELDEPLPEIIAEKEVEQSYNLNKTN